MGKYHNKPLPFNKSDPDDMALLEFAQSIKYTKLAKEWLRSLRDGRLFDYREPVATIKEEPQIVSDVDLGQFL